MSELGLLQETFMRLLPGLLNHAHVLGFEVRGGDLFRDPAVHGAIGVKMGYGHPKSAHKQKLAIDLNLTKDGKYLTSTEDHRALGEWWEERHPLARWGGRFDDGNHYSLEYMGIK
jgi:hypothetical protein